MSANTTTPSSVLQSAARANDLRLYNTARDQATYVPVAMNSPPRRALFIERGAASWSSWVRYNLTQAAAEGKDDRVQDSAVGGEDSGVGEDTRTQIVDSLPSGDGTLSEEVAEDAHPNLSSPATKVQTEVDDKAEHVLRNVAHPSPLEQIVDTPLPGPIEDASSHVPAELATDNNDISSTTDTGDETSGSLGSSNQSAAPNIQDDHEVGPMVGTEALPIHTAKLETRRIFNLTLQLARSMNPCPSHSLGRCTWVFPLQLRKKSSSSTRLVQ
jgi:hypothetical protein